jgi:hypothetical protein
VNVNELMIYEHRYSGEATRKRPGCGKWGFGEKKRI